MKRIILSSKEFYSLENPEKLTDFILGVSIVYSKITKNKSVMISFEKNVFSIKEIIVELDLFEQIWELKKHIDELLSVGNADKSAKTNQDEMIFIGKSESEVVIKCNVELANHFKDYLKNVLFQIENDCLGELRIQDILLVSSTQFEQLVYNVNQTNNNYKDYMLIHQLFEEQVNRTPHKIAISTGTSNITYSMLNCYANGLANYLINNGIKIGDRVAVIKERDIDMIIVLMAILKVGAVYVPIEKSVPEQRVITIIQITEAKLLITNPEYLDAYVSCNKNVLCTGWSENKFVVYAEINKVKCEGNIEQENLNVPINSNSLAYIIFTSGTTGIPKGVMINHRSVINIIEWMNNTFSIDSSDKNLFVTSISFDLSVYDIFGILAAGGEIRLANYNELADPKALFDIIVDENITIWDSAPPALKLVMPFIEKNKKIYSSKLKKVFLSGDWIPLSMPKILMEQVDGINVISLGGATEATIWSNYYIINEVKLEWKSIPYGKPIQNAKYYILDEYLNPVPVGMEGDLYIAGDCLSLGYIGNEVMTSKAFITNPFEENQLMYKTGDVARWMPDYNMELIGRSDNQVKVRGYRIELGEIQSVIQKYENVKDCLVGTIDEGDDKKICAYVTKKDNENVESINTWKEIFDSNYHELELGINPKRNFKGWNSSFTGNEIPENEMHEWLDNTLWELNSLQPQNVLEIGCGTGMLLFNLNEKCESYTGSDLSQDAIDYINRVIRTDENRYHNIQVFQNAADDFGHYRDRKFDTVIMNSVIQYFPSITYLKKVIEQAIELIDRKGQIFLGDLRNFDLMDEFYRSIALIDSENRKLTEEELQAKVSELKTSNSELLISPAFFYQLLEEDSDISNVTIFSKKSKYQNEMSLFRCDVVLSIDKENKEEHLGTEKEEHQLFEYSLDGTIDFTVKQNQSFIIKNIPNKNLVDFLLENEKNTISTTLCQELLGYKHIFDENYQIIMELISRENTKCYMLANLSNKYSYDLLVVSNECSDSVLEILKNRKTDELNNYCLQNLHNCPKAKNIDDSYIRGLKEYLRRILPEYMIPYTICIVQEYPVTINGKVDWKKLEEIASAYYEYDLANPQNELEEELAEIWKIVLGVSKIGTNCNFFEWGGHSLKANSIVFEVEKRMGITCKSQNVFQNPTITEFAVFLTKQKKGLSQEKIEKNTENIVRVTEEQSRLYWATKMSDDKLLYNVVDCVRIQGEMDIEKIKYSFSKVVELHDSFRLSFYDEGGVVYSEIHDEVIPKINYLCIDEKVIDEEIQKVITPFEFEDPSLVRLHLLQAESKKLYLVIDAHHMVLDGISLSIIQKELSDIYNGTLVEKNELDYLDYVQWKINKPEDTDCMQYWTNRLSGVDTIAALPADQIKKVKTSFRGQSLYFPIEDSEYLLWEKATRSCGCTMFTYLSAVYAILLQKYCQEENIVLGTVTSNRDRSEFESMVGMFVNTLPLRIDLDGEASFINYVKKVQADFENDMRFQNVSLDSILDTFGEIGESKQLPFSNVIVLQNMDVNRYSFGSNSVKRKMINVGISKFDVSFIFNYLNGKIELEVEYSTDIYQKERIFNVVKNYFNLLHFISSNIEKKISELTLGEISEIKKDYQEINSTSCELIGTQPVHELIFEHSYADHYAIVQDDRRITYDELETMVHNLSACLFRNGVHSGDRVGVIMHGSIELVVSWMAILEVGAVLMPLSPEYPEERIGYILKDSGCKCLLGMEKNDTFSLEQILVDHHHLLDPQEQLLSKPPVSLNDIAYIIYTSGSTGTPKGVKISHKSLLNLCEWHIRYFEITSKDKSTKYAGEGFDASIWEVFPALLAGAELHIISQNIRLDLVRLNEYFNENQITVAFLPTQVCEEFTKLKNISLRCLLTGGDKLDSCMNNQYIVYNNYGPTENTVVSTCFPVVQTYENIPIGKPISNTHVYVCDTYGNILPKGIAGELIVSGLGISRGYVNDEEQTKSKFKALSYDQYDTAYFTGDIVKFDGENLIFLGRQDNQVKIRGYRIEVNEIQSVAQKYELIDDCIIACQDTFGKKQVNCYYLSQEEINVSDFKQYMRKYLPEYMIPKTFTQITQIPMNANGKIDYRKLVPNIEEYGYIDEQSLSAEEQALLAVWKKVLGLERIEANKNFFELGGDSIKAMKMMSELMSLGSTFSMKEFFENPTFHSNSNNIMQVKSYDSTILKEDIQLLPIQKWFLNKKYTDNTYFCMTEVLEFENVIDQERLLQAFEQVMECHEILKAVIYKENNKWNQKINSKSGVSVKYVKENRRVTGEAELLTFAMLVQEELRDNMNSNVSIGLCQMDHVNYCIVSINHLFIDAYSFRIIIDDFIKCYEVNESVHLVRTASVNEWAKVYEQYYHQNSLTEDITYWQSYYQVEKSSLSKAYVLEKSVFADSDKACAVVDEDVVSKMIKNGDQAYGIDILMLTALSAAVQKTFGNQKVEINLENFGRNCIYPDIEISRTIGWLTNKYPILLEVKSSEKWINRIIETKKAIESVPNRGFFHDYIVNELSLCGDNMKDPQISFNYLGQYNESYHDSKIKYSNFQLENGVDSKIQKFFDLDINARVSENGKMYIDLDYNRYEFKKSTITALMAEFSQNIRMIVDEVF